MDLIKVSNRELFNILIDSLDNDFSSLKNRVPDIVIKYLNEKFKLNSTISKLVSQKLRKYFVSGFCSRLKSSFYNKNRFLSDNELWLDSDFVVSAISETNRELKSFEECSKSTQKRRIENVLNDIPPSEILEVCQSKLRKSKGDNTHKKQDSSRDIIKFTSEEALALLIDAKLSKAQYELIRGKLKEKNCDVLPSYKSVTSAKTECYPTIQISENGACIALQDLLDHTVQRMMKVEKISQAILNSDTSNFMMISKYGGDGCSGFNRYKQHYNDLNNNDENVFMLSTVPIRIEINEEEQNKSVIWQNPRTSSTKYCRPIKFDFVKESKEKIELEMGDISKQIESLKSTELHVCGKVILVGHTLICTMVDGKIVQVITNTSSASVCVVCKATPSQMNKLDLVLKKPVDLSAYQFGLQSLHCWIRFMECVLHISYRLSFKKWIVREKEDKELLEKSKKRIKDDIRKELGLLVDSVKQGSGSTNDGNTARKFFRNYEIIARITGFDEKILRRLYVILQTLSSGKEIDTLKFKKYSLETARRYVEKYSWYYMPASMHKVFIHGADILDSLVIPSGHSSEDAQEARNKDLKRGREERTRKTSRLDTNEDLMHFLLVSSDPYISSLRKEITKKDLDLLPESIELIQS